ncbi:hypothetical protein JOM56_004582 [Amanita muscaria]
MSLLEIMRALLLRSACTQCCCLGATFGELPNATHTPSSANMLCVCGHEYWKHALLKAEVVRCMVENQLAFRGGRLDTGCGGFYPRDTVVAIAGTMACICGSRYCDHELSVRETPPTSRTGQTVSVMNQPPIPSPLSAVFSAARFPRFPPPAASNLSTGQERQRQAGRIEYKADPEYLPSQATQSQARSPTKQPQVDPALQCAIIPFRATPTSLKSNTHPPGLFKFDDEDCHHLVRELASYNLIFDLDESGIESEDGEVWETLDMQIKTLLELHQIEMLSCEFENDAYLSLAWKFCVPGRSNKYKAETPLQYKCNIAYVRRIAQPHPLSRGTSVFFIGMGSTGDSRGAYYVLEVPRNDSLKACVMEDGQLSQQPHPCWPWRVVSKLPWIQLPEDTSRTCIAQCTNDGDESQPRQRTNAHRDRNRSAQRLPVASSSRAVNTQRSAPFAGEGPRGQVPEAAQVQPPTAQATERPPTPPPVEHLKNQDAPVIDRLTSAEVDSWRRDIQTHPRVGNTGVYIRAPDSETLAQTLIALLQLQASDKQSTAGFEPAQGVVVRVPDITSLMNAFPLFQIQGNQSEGSTGIGPVREVYDTALSLRIRDEKRWSPSTTGGYHTVNLCSNPAMEDKSLALEYKVDGMLFALYLITVGVGPDPISPFVLYAACVDDVESMELPKDYALGMVPDDSTAKAVDEIFEFNPTDTVSIGDLMNSRLASLVMDHILLGANWVLKARGESQHRMLQAQMLTKILIGHHNPWTHPHFKAFCEGFSCGPSFGKLLKMPTDEWDADLSYARRLLAAVYNRRIDDAGAIVNQISWVGTNPADPVNHHFYQLFVMRANHWLSGVGHPRELVGEYINQATYEQDRWDRGLRARLLYKAITGSSLIVGNATIQLAYLPDFRGDTLFEAKVCFTTLKVTINSFVRDKLLLQPGNMASNGGMSRFDRWWHVQLLSLATGFNSI